MKRNARWTFAIFAAAIFRLCDAARQHRAAEEARPVDPLGPEPRLQQVVRGKGEGVRQEVGLRGRGGHHSLPGIRGQVPGGLHGEEQRARHLHGNDAPMVRAVRFLRQDAGRSGKDLRPEPAEVHGRHRQVEGRALRHPDRARQLPADVHQRRHVQEGRPRSGRPAEDVHRRLALGHEEADHRRSEGRRSDCRWALPSGARARRSASRTSSSPSPTRGAHGC